MPVSGLSKGGFYKKSLITSCDITGQGTGKSAALNSLIGHTVLPTGENGATRAPISIELTTVSHSHFICLKNALEGA
ncbi:hypothetical protein SLE2022_086340 [Rubroshorea leprosula]